MFYVVILLFSACVTHLYGDKSFLWGVVTLRYCTYNSVITVTPNEALRCTRNCSFYRNGNLANFFRMLVKAKYFKGCLLLLEMEQLLVFDQSKDAGCVVWSCGTSLLIMKCHNSTQRSLRPQTSVRYVSFTPVVLDARLNNQVIPQQSIKTQKIQGYRHTRKTSGIFYGTLDPEIILLAGVPQQNFPLLQKL